MNVQQLQALLGRLEPNAKIAPFGNPSSISVTVIVDKSHNNELLLVDHKLGAAMVKNHPECFAYPW